MKLLILSDLENCSFDDWMRFLDENKNSFQTVLLLGGIEVDLLRLITDSLPVNLIFGVNGDKDNDDALNSCGVPNLNKMSLNLNNTVISGIEGCLSYEEDSFVHTEKGVFEIIKELSFETDIIISHNSPFGIHDKKIIDQRGYFGLREFIECYSPRYCLHGHQNINKVTKYKNTKIVGVYGGILLNTRTGAISQVL